MIEREAKTDEDRPKIARVIYNRLAHRHAAGDRRQRALRHAAGRASTRTPIPFSEQRETPGPYNTYLNAGLPPTPIANPGRASIRAALNPAPNPSVGDPLCADLPDGVAVRVPLLRARRRGRRPRLRRDRRAARGQRRRGRPPPACSTDRGRPCTSPPSSARRSRHSLSPAIHNAAFAAGRARLGVRRLRRRAGRRPAALDAMRALGIAGLSVTTPHKEDVAAAVDELAPAAAALRSVNTVVVARRRRAWSATAPTATASSPRSPRPASASPARRSPCVGAGAAARSVVDALGRAGAGDDRRRQPDAGAGRGGGRAGRGRRGSARPPTSPAADVVVNATSVGMGTDELPFDPALLRAGPGRRRPRVPPAARRRCCAPPRERGLPHRRRPRDARPPGRPAAGAVDRRRPDPAMMRAAAAELPAAAAPSVAASSADASPLGTRTARQ